MGEMAAILAGGIAAGIYPTDTPSQVTLALLFGCHPPWVVGHFGVGRVTTMN